MFPPETVETSGSTNQAPLSKLRDLKTFTQSKSRDRKLKLVVVAGVATHDLSDYRDQKKS